MDDRSEALLAAQPLSERFAVENESGGCAVGVTVGVTRARAEW
jgi:hypothetical protein